MSCQILTVKEVSVLLRCGLSVVYDLFKDGHLKGFHIRPGSQKGIRILHDSVERLIQGEAQPGPPPVQEEPVRPRPKVPKAPRGLVLRPPA